MKITAEYLVDLLTRLAGEEAELRRQAEAKKGARDACQHLLEQLSMPEQAKARPELVQEPDAAG